MADAEGNLTIVERPSNPCYGYLRKYRSTHGETATQPEHKPGDLHYPFPDGEPVALAIPFYASPEQIPLLDFIWGPQSPWINGFGSPDNVVRTYNDMKAITGIILTNTDVDPTVMVNLLKMSKSRLHSVYQKWNKLLLEGLSEFEALACCTLDGHNFIPSGADTYMFPTKANLKGMKEGKTNDFSGGTFRKRFDYSRKNIQDIFADKNGITLAAEMEKVAKEKGIKFVYTDIKPYAEVAKEVIRKYI